MGTNFRALADLINELKVEEMKEGNHSYRLWKPVQLDVSLKCRHGALEWAVPGDCAAVGTVRKSCSGADTEVHAI